MKKRRNFNRAGNVDVDAWRAGQIAKLLRRQLAERNMRFQSRHGEDTDLELREFVYKTARDLGRMPHPLELEGGPFLQERLGDWKALARSLGFCPPGKKQGERIYRRLREQAAEEFRKERKAKKRCVPGDISYPDERADQSGCKAGGET